ncbi:adhesion G-protein coupled receptor D1-like [Asterias rubens]|uniref:adhesion G-protein coupled receptor D1-like n=1 Tax=Asterias rubens TaxID=7604 RepID=UPI001455AC41|nr:adhesion G-protein coupled receptor D1-like [Asterias rubens]
MALEGAFLYIKASPTFRWKIRLPVWLLIGWGCPLVIVGMSVAARMHNYTRHTSCWLSFEDGFIWSFLAPVLLIITGNTLVLIRLLVVFMSLKTNQDKTERMKMKAGLRLIIILEPLLGLPWIFGFVFAGNIVFTYFFVIFNSLQGLFVFLSQCVFDKEVRQKFNQKSSKVQNISFTQDSTKATEVAKVSGI